MSLNLTGVCQGTYATLDQSGYGHIINEYRNGTMPLHCTPYDINKELVELGAEYFECHVDS